jgi:hypothetical protein
MWDHMEPTCDPMWFHRFNDEFTKRWVKDGQEMDVYHLSIYKNDKLFNDY